MCQTLSNEEMLQEASTTASENVGPTDPPTSPLSPLSALTPPVLTPLPLSTSSSSEQPTEDVHTASSPPVFSPPSRKRKRLFLECVLLTSRPVRKVPKPLNAPEVAKDMHANTSKTGLQTMGVVVRALFLHFYATH